MIQKIVAGYGKLFISLLKVLALVVLCALFAFVLVLPLWKFATVNPQAYSVTVLVSFALGILFFTGKNLRVYLTAGFPTQEEKKKRLRHLLNMAGRFIIIISGLIGIVICILNESTVATWIILLLTIVLYGVLAFGTKKEKKI